MNKTINKNVVGIVFFAILMLLFTFLDLPVAKLIYAPASAFGRFTVIWSEINDSFPSGHAAQAATSLFLVLVSGFVNVEDKCRLTKICAVIAGAFTICVMLSRMVLGMHFATDVIGGAAFTLISMKLTQMVLDKF